MIPTYMASYLMMCMTVLRIFSATDLARALEDVCCSLMPGENPKPIQAHPRPSTPIHARACPLHALHAPPFPNPCHPRIPLCCCKAHFEPSLLTAHGFLHCPPSPSVALVVRAGHCSAAQGIASHRIASRRVASDGALQAPTMMDDGFFPCRRGARKSAAPYRWRWTSHHSFAIRN